MKKICLVLLVGLLLSGCSWDKLEVVKDGLVTTPAAASYHLELQLPEGSTAPVMEADGASIYFCDDFSVSVQKLSGGDLDKTIIGLTGMDLDRTAVLKTKKDNFDCYRLVWSSAGEGTEMTCWALVLDDGIAHHAVTVMADHRLAGDLKDQWNAILNTAQLIRTE